MSNYRVSIRVDRMSDGGFENVHQEVLTLDEKAQPDYMRGRDPA